MSNNIWPKQVRSRSTSSTLRMLPCHKRASVTACTGACLLAQGVPTISGPWPRQPGTGSCYSGSCEQPLGSTDRAKADCPQYHIVQA